MTRPATNFSANAAHRRWMYANDPEYRLKRQRKSDAAQKRRRKVVDDIVGPIRCEVCGDSRRWVLDFHHRNPAEKSFAINTAYNRKFPAEEIAAEVAKCSILCSNCHRDLHYRTSAPRMREERG